MNRDKFWIFSATFVLLKTSPFRIRAAPCWWKHEAGQNVCSADVQTGKPTPPRGFKGHAEVQRATFRGSTKRCLVKCRPAFYICFNCRWYGASPLGSFQLRRARTGPHPLAVVPSGWVADSPALPVSSGRLEAKAGSFTILILCNFDFPTLSPRRLCVLAALNSMAALTIGVLILPCLGGSTGWVKHS